MLSRQGGIEAEWYVLLVEKGQFKVVGNSGSGRRLLRPIGDVREGRITFVSPDTGEEEKFCFVGAIP